MIIDPVSNFFNYMFIGFSRNFLNNSAILQILGSLASFLLAFLCSRSVLNRLEQIKIFNRIKLFYQNKITAIIVVSLWMIFEVFVLLIGVQTDIGTHISRPIFSFLAAWMTIRTASYFIKDPAYSKLVSIGLWIVSSLLILGLFNPIVQLLHQLSITIGSFHLSLWMLLKASVTLLFVVWIALALSRWAERQIQSNRHIEPSSKVLLSKFTKMAFVALGVMLGLSNIGFDLSIFTFFGGAIGVGIGFGLQKVVSNLICGIVLLLDRTVKPGDVIALGPSNFGIVNRLGARCVSVRTLAGEEHLIPNEEMITSKIENWSYTDSNLRVEVTIRVGFNEDVDLALRLLRQAAFNVRRILLDPRPVALIQNISDYAIELSLKVWIEDPHLGLGELKSELYFNILRLFKQHQIEIPYPQQAIFMNENKELFSFEKSSPKEV
jgi:small-conductance mechanosensitive channel